MQLRLRIALCTTFVRVDCFASRAVVKNLEDAEAYTGTRDTGIFVAIAARLHSEKERRSWTQDGQHNLPPQLPQLCLPWMDDSGCTSCTLARGKITLPSKWPPVAAFAERANAIQQIDIKNSNFGPIVEASEICGNNTFKTYIGMTSVVIIQTPNAAEALLTSRYSHRKPFIHSFNEPWLRVDHRRAVSGGTRKTMRKLMFSAFKPASLTRCLRILNESGDILAHRFSEYADGTFNEPIQLFQSAQRCTLDIIGEVATGVKLRLQETADENYHLIKAKVKNTFQFFDRWLWLPRRSNGRNSEQEIANTLRDVEPLIYSTMQERRDQMKIFQIIPTFELDDDEIPGNGRNAVLLDSLLLTHLREKSYTLVDVMKDIGCFLLAGSDATLSAVTWSIYMLGLHPKTQAKVHRELDAIFGTDTDRCVTSDDLERMKYLECCIKETMRLYPPVPIVGRFLEHDQVIDNQTVPKGVQCFVNVFRLHRNPKYFSDPERYFPERFMREETTFRPPFVYIPFSGGARKCLGQAFAMMEIKLLLAKIFSKFKVEFIRPLDHPKINIDEIISAREELRVWIRRREVQE